MRYVAVAVAIVLVAFAVRLFRVAELPAGFHFDEASELIDAGLIATGQLRPVYFPDTDHSVAREALYLYWQAFFVTIAGFAPFAARIASVFVGTLTVAATYRLVLELFPGANGRPTKVATALLSSAILALLFWHVHMSRIALRAVSLPLLEVLAFVFLWRALRRRKLRHYALFGVFLGLSLHSYTASRILPLVALPVLVWGLWRQGIAPRERLTVLGVALAALSIVVLPLAYLSATQPDLVWEHTLAQVALDDGFGQAILERALATAGMFSLVGDARQDFNLAGRPVFDPAMALLFYGGVAISLASLFGRWRHRLVLAAQGDPLGALPYAFLILWLAAMLTPGIINGGAPHFLHSIGAVPVVAIFAGLPLSLLATVLQTKMSLRASRRWLWAAGALAVAWHGGVSLRDYFGDYAARPETYRVFDGSMIDMTRYVKERSQEVRVYLDPFLRDRPTASVFLRSTPFTAFDPRRTAVFQPVDAEYLFFTYNRDVGNFALFLPGSVVPEIVRDTLGQPALLSFRLAAKDARSIVEAVAGKSADGAGVRFHQVAPRQYVFADQFALRSYALRTSDRWLAPGEPLAPGTQLDVVLGWLPLRRPTANYTISVKLVDAAGRVWAQDDAPPGGASYATAGWQPEEVILDWHPMAIPQAIPAGRYRLWVSAYQPPDLATIPVICDDTASGCLAMLDLGPIERRQP